ncbi:hypothetical protein OG875_19130 [Streptomyces sp. NBC_01498]|uniref:hypothetical protein n=1 Tax=Streptomyces sp. NBC_01498 TaxID=2975870 RepID=UPI002E7ABFBB|nr:hypothetical protein [Streptomyces sp. NBC_01498]WTL26506.1 hypothetical protein OG875_19130 [Streptomyces sp. NBC_01498]
MSLALLLTTAAATAVGVAALHAAHGLRREVTALRGELSLANEAGPVAVPQARSAEPAPAATSTEDIRLAVAEALAEERERELAEARAFWAAQEARDASDAPSLLGGFGGPGSGGDDGMFYVPRQADFVGLESLDLDALDRADRARRAVEEDYDDLAELAELAGLREHGEPDAGDPAAYEDLDEHPDTRAGLGALPDLSEVSEVSEVGEYAEDSPELAAARRRHPSHPDFVPVRTPVITDHERTVARLEELAGARTALADVRPGPLGTLDVYVFTDGTTLCMTPGHRETAERLAGALRDGGTPFLLGGSGVSGAYALTFSSGVAASTGDGPGTAGPGATEDDTAGDHIYVLADRVIASL